MPVTVTHGAYRRQFACAGRTVGEVKERLKYVFNIANEATAFVDGIEVGLEQLLDDGDDLEFVKTDGLKSSLHDLWSQSEVEQLFGQEALSRMIAAGLEFKMHMSIKSHELIYWAGSFAAQGPVANAKLPISVDIEQETITVDAKAYQIDKQMAAAVQCLLEARGERRSCQDMRTNTHNTSTMNAST